MKLEISIAILAVVPAVAQPGGEARWRHLSAGNGDLPLPNPGTQQTATAVFDIDKDGVNDFVIAERTRAPSVTRCSATWTATASRT
jgi:hypothetical protein